MKLHKHLNNEEVVEWFNIPWLTECKKKEQGQKKKRGSAITYMLYERVWLPFCSWL